MKTIGYLLAIIGLILLALGLNKSILFKLKIPVLSSLNSLYLISIAIITIIIGVSIMIRSGKNNKGKREVPIYEGEGKKRKIIGYKVEGK